MLRCARNAPQRPTKNANPSWVSEKKTFILYKACDFVHKVEISVLRGVGWSLQKVLILVQGPQHKSTSDPVWAPKNNQFGAIFIDFGNTKKCYTLSELELVPKSSKKLIGSLSCMHKRQKCIQTESDHPKRIPFVEKYKECAICAILREKTPFWGIPRG